uniref:SCAN box domain-containing protein n=1 Tax=Pseudonaja textilis TaxID=8673 RepID=A0A670Z769_PSETE
MEGTRQNASEEPVVHSEVQRQHFRNFCYQEMEGPHHACCQLWDLCHQWLKPGKHTKLQMLELVILEQFQAILPQKVQEYVKEREPSTCDQAVSLAEEFIKSQQREEKRAADASKPKRTPSHTKRTSGCRNIAKEEDGVLQGENVLCPHR